MTAEWTEPLSPEGERRREAIAAMARHAARGRRLRRRVIQSSVAAAVLLALCWPTVLWLRSSGRQALPDRVVVESNPSPTVAMSSVAINRVETDAGITERLSIHRPQPRWQAVGDDDLLQTLAQAGHPAGLVEMNGEARLLLR
jgi:hypothetical protein